MSHGHQRTYETDAIRVHWDSSRCIHTGICLRTLPSVFSLRRRPWVDLRGADVNKPFCDSSHAQVGFRSLPAETPLERREAETPAAFAANPRVPDPHSASHGGDDHE